MGVSEKERIKDAKDQGNGIRGSRGRGGGEGGE
jgi:hypothetical protein